LRIHGFDLLRGICAISVAVYHLLNWTHIHFLHNLGIVSVHIFFILSGASIYIAYAQRMAHGLPVLNFLGQRLFRIAPLFWLLLAVQAITKGHSLPDIVYNASFAFAFISPSANSMLVGQWTLGIELLFYLLFPLMLVAVTQKQLILPVLLLLLACQQYYVSTVIQVPSDMSRHWSAYAQFISFCAYFFGGCLIGKLYLANRNAIPRQWTWPLFILLLITLWPICMLTMDTDIAGISGLLFIGLSLAITFVSAYIPVSIRWVWASAAMGKSSYGVYLIHPVMWGYVSYSLSAMTDIPSATGTIAAIAITIGLSILFALVIETYYERPIRRSGYRLLHITPQPVYSH
jgi:peptidoglycan/LPS O-acetylase OafA/YrhL